MKNKIDRRTFIKLLVVSSLGSLTLSSCKKPQKQTMTCSELLDYDLINYNDGEEKLAYIIYDGYGKYYALNFDNGLINSDIIYDVANDKDQDFEKDLTENLTNYLNITYMEPALISLDENIGPKYEYDAKDLQDNLDKLKVELKVQTKTLLK